MDDVVKLLLSIAGGTDAQLRGHDIILYAATDEIDRLRAERDGLAEKAKLHDYMQEVAKANGYDCLTDAITKANAYGKERDSLAAQLAEAETAQAIEVAEADKIAEDNAVLRLQLAAATGVIEAAKAHYAFHRPEEPMHCGVCRAVYALSARALLPPSQEGVK